MDKEANQQSLRPAGGQMLAVKIMDEAARLRAKPEWAATDRLSVSLVKDAALNILLMVLKKGAHLKEHRTKGPIAVQVLSGAIRFTAAHQPAELAPGSIAALDRNVVHELEALDESVVLLITAIG